jgi:hypothetical protein
MVTDGAEVANESLMIGKKEKGQRARGDLTKRKESKRKDH